MTQGDTMLASDHIAGDQQPIGSSTRCEACGTPTATFVTS